MNILMIIIIFSRLSGGSTKSEMLDRDKKYGKGIIRKLTHKLTKSSSVDDPNMTDYSLQARRYLNIRNYFYANRTLFIKMIQYLTDIWF